MKPRKPTERKAVLHPALSRIHASKGGARIAPMDEPLLKTPEASDRSSAGNHSATSFTPAGWLPASPMPSRKRKMPRLRAPAASAHSISAADHEAIVHA